MKTYCLSLCCVFAMLAPCLADAQTKGAFEGAFVSFGVARTATHIVKSNVTTVDGYFDIDQPDANGHSLQPEIEAGYGFDLGHKFNTSINVYYRMGTATVQDTQATHFQDTVEQSLKNQFGLYIATGYYVTDSTLFFAKLGLTTAHQTYLRANPGVNLTPPLTEKIDLDQMVAANSFGLGVKHKFSQNHFLVLDFTKDIYPNKQIGENVNLNNIDVNIRSQVDQETVSFRLGYMF